MRWTAMLALLLLFSGCTAHRGSAEHFTRPKYKIRVHARNGAAHVTQRWWSKHWGWERNKPRTNTRKR